MTKDELRHFLGTHGYHVRFDEYISRKGDGTSNVYVKIWAAPQTQANRWSLGTLSEVQKLDGDAVLALIEARAAKKAERAKVRALTRP